MRCSSIRRCCRRLTCSTVRRAAGRATLHMYPVVRHSGTCICMSYFNHKQRRLYVRRWYINYSIEEDTVQTYQQKGVPLGLEEVASGAQQLGVVLSYALQAAQLRLHKAQCGGQRGQGCVVPRTRVLESSCSKITNKKRNKNSGALNSCVNRHISNQRS